MQNRTLSPLAMKIKRLKLRRTRKSTGQRHISLYRTGMIYAARGNDDAVLLWLDGAR